MDELGALNLKGKKVAIFGCSDSVAYVGASVMLLKDYAAFEPSGAELIGKTDPPVMTFQIKISRRREIFRSAMVMTMKRTKLKQSRKLVCATCF